MTLAFKKVNLGMIDNKINFLTIRVDIAFQLNIL